MDIIDFNQPLAHISLEGTIVFLGYDELTDLYSVAYDIPEWVIYEVDEFGVIPGEIEPFVINVDIPVVQRLTVGLYPDNSTSSTTGHPDNLPIGDFGRAILDFTFVAGELDNVDVIEVLPRRT